jgi:2-acylglycerol O-acyltransferase 2
LWRHFREYFPSRLIGSRAPLNPSQPYVVAIHPHGVWSVGVFANFVFENQALPGVDYRVATISNNFRVPFWRDLLLGLGFVSADRQTFENLLGDRKSICVVVGGAKEALDSRPGTNDLTLSTRLGFVRLAMQNGAHLIPVYTFGETDVYAQVLPNPPGSLVRWVQEKLLDWFGYSVPVILGSFGVLPRRRPITTIVGDPVVVPHSRDPTTEQVALAHDAYVKALQKLFDEHADYYAPNRKSDLRLVDTPSVKTTPAPVSAKSRL